MHMRVTTLLLSVGVCIWLSSFSPASRADIVELLPRIKQSIAGVGTLHPLRSPRIKLTGTGFVVADGSYVVTNAHVPPLLLDEEKGESLAVFLHGPEGLVTRKVTKIAEDQEHDLALLKMDGTPVPALRIGNSDTVKEGQSFFFTGYPIGAILGLHPATHRAGLAAIAPIYSPTFGARSLTSRLIKRADAPFDIFQLDATAYPGNSGSPVYDGVTGEVVAVVNSVFIKGSKESMLKDPSGISYAIPAKYIKQMLDTAGLSASYH